MEPADAAKYMVQRVDAHERHDSWRRAMAARGTAAFTGAGMEGLWDGLPVGDVVRATRKRWGGYGSKARWNFAKAIAETYCEKLTGSEQPKTQMVTTDASWEDHRSAVWYDRFIEGSFHEEQGMFQDVWDLCRHGFKLQGVATGTVAARIEPDYVGKRVRTELRSTMNTFIDPADVVRGVPLTYVDVTWENPEYMLADKDRYGSDRVRDIIWKSAEVPQHLSLQGCTDARWETPMVKVVTAWRMPFGDFEGRRAQFIGHEWVDWDDWKFETPPLAFFRADRTLSGFWGMNFIEQMLGALEIVDKVNGKVEQAMEKLSDTWILSDIRSKTTGKVLQAKNVAVIEWDSQQNGQKPEIVHNDMIAEQYLRWQQTNLEMAHRLTGIDEMHVDSASQHGAESGKSKRLEAALLPERHAKSLRGYRQWVAVDCAKRYAAAAREIGKRVPNWQVTWPGHDFAARVGVSALNLDEKKFTMRPYAVSEIKNTPVDRAAAAEEMFERGEITSEQRQIIINGAYDVPKQSQETSVQRRFVSKVLDHILHCDKKLVANEAQYMSEHYMAPYPWIGAEEATVQAVDIYAQAMIDGVPQNRRRLLRRFIEDLAKMIANKVPPASEGMNANTATAGPVQPWPIQQQPAELSPAGAGLDAAIGAPPGAPLI